MVCSAADSTLDCGAFTTMTPRRVAASTSTLSRPMPARPDDDELVGRLDDLRGDLRGAADHQRRRAPDRVEQLVGREPQTDVDLEAGGAHGLEPAVGELLTDQDASLRHRTITLITGEAIRGSGRGPERFAGLAT